VLIAQVFGSAVVTLATFSIAMIVMLVVNATGTLRLPAEFELYGMDLHEHGISAYPEYVITALGSPTGLASQQQQPVTSSMKATAPAHGD
jgi:Amt family ammonium transporter